MQPSGEVGLFEMMINRRRWLIGTVPRALSRDGQSVILSV